MRAVLALVGLAAAAADPEENVMASFELSENDAWLSYVRMTSSSVDRHRRIYPPDSLRRLHRGKLLPVGTPARPKREVHAAGHEGHSHAPPDFLNDTEEYVHVLYHTDAGDVEPTHWHTFDDPRKHMVHGWDPVTESFMTGIEWLQHGTVEVVLPPHVRQVVVEHRGSRHSLSVPDAEGVRRRGKILYRRREARGGRMQTLASDASSNSKVVKYSLSPTGEQKPLPQGGPTTTQNNFVFLSGGYVAADEEQFLKDLDYVVTLFDTSCDTSSGQNGGGDGPCKNAQFHMPPTVPFRRYASSFNIFAVWQPSEQTGASQPNDGITVKNNLDCSYGTSVPRALLCTPSMVQALADTAPCAAFDKENVVAVVLVNANSYGGAASYRYKPTTRVGAFATGYFRPFTSANQQVSSPLGTFGSLFFHEVGHCYANLMDEYNTGITENQDKYYVNCASEVRKSGGNGGIPWQGWIDCCPDTASAKTHLTKASNNFQLSAAEVSDNTLQYFTVDPQPDSICGWSNYWQPSTKCMMEKLTARESGYSYSLVPRLCPVCREATVTMMYDTGMDTSQPKCPLKDEELYVSDSQGSYIFINSLFTSLTKLEDGGKVQVTWQCGASASALSAAPWEGASGRSITEFDPKQPSYVYVTGADLRTCGATAGGAAVIVQVTVNDRTPWVLASRDRTKMEQKHQWSFKYVTDLAASGAKRRCNTTCLNDTDPHQGRDWTKELHSCIDPTGATDLAKLPHNTQPQNIKDWIAGKLCADGTSTCAQKIPFTDTDKLKFDYWAKCDSADTSKLCYLEFNSRTYNASLAAGKSSSKDSVDSLVFGLPGAIAITAVALFLITWWRCARQFRMGAKKNIFDTNLDKPVSLIRRTIITAGIFFAFVAVAALGIGLWLYTQVGEFLKVALILAFVLAIDLFIMAFVGTTAAYFRARGLLFLNSFGLLVALAVMCWLTHTVQYIGDNVVTPPCTSAQAAVNASSDLTLQSSCSQAPDQDVALCGIEGVGCELRALWRTAVSNFPDKICSFQEELKCSGYLQPCDKNPSSTYCPKGCFDDPEGLESPYGDACKIKVQDDIKSNCETLFPIMVGLTVAMACALFNNFVLAVMLTMQRSRQRDAQVDQLRDFTAKSRAASSGQSHVGSGSKSKAIRLLRCLTPQQRERISKRFKEADKDGNGTLDRREMELFLKAVLSPDLTKAEVQEAFDLADRNKDGTVDFREFVDLFSTGGAPSAGREMSPKQAAPMPPVDDSSPRGGSQYQQLRDSQASSGVQRTPSGPPGQAPAARRTPQAQTRSRPGSMVGGTSTGLSQPPRGGRGAAPPRRSRSPVGTSGSV